MSRRGSGLAPGKQEQSTSRRSSPQQYHEDSYFRSSRHETSDEDSPDGDSSDGETSDEDSSDEEASHDEMSRQRAGRFLRIPGFTSHQDQFQHMPSVASQFPGSSTVIANAGPDVGVDPFAGPNAHHHQPNNAVSDPDHVGQGMSWPYQQPAVPRAFLPAFRPASTTRGYPYPMELDIPSGPMGQTTDHSLRVARPISNDLGRGTNDSTLVVQPQIPRPLSQRSGTQTSNVRIDPRRQPTDQHLSAYGDSPTTAHDHTNRPRYSPSAPPRRPRNP